MSSSRYYFGKPVPVSLKILSLVVPLLLLGLVTVGLCVWKNGGAAWEMWSLILASYFYANKLVILWSAAPAADFGPWFIAGLIVGLDLATVLFMIANLDILYRTPYAGRKLREIRKAGWQILHVHKWLGRVAVLGLAIFVAFPVFGTGSIGGTLFARLVGLERRGTVAGVMLGSVAGCAALAAGCSFAKNNLHLLEHPVWLVGVVALLVAAIIVLDRIAKRGTGAAPPPPEEFAA